MKNRMFHWLAAVISCLCMVFFFSASADAKETFHSLTLDYGGKTAVIHDNKGVHTDRKYQIPDHFLTFNELKKTFGKPKLNKDLSTSSFKVYEYREKGVQLSFAVPKKSARIAGVIIDITSNKAALNGIKTGMSFHKVKNKLEKDYGKSFVRVSSRKDHILLQYSGGIPVEYLFKNGKVSWMYLWSFWCF